MKKRNGFTLIELLAVIVILAIIALISVPMVLKYIKQAKEGAGEQSVHAMVKAAETYYMANMDDTEFPMTVSFPDADNTLNLKNANNASGYLSINDDGYTELLITINDTTYAKNYNDDKIYNLNKDNFVYEGDPNEWIVSERHPEKLITWNPIDYDMDNLIYDYSTIIYAYYFANTTDFPSYFMQPVEKKETLDATIKEFEATYKNYMRFIPKAVKEEIKRSKELFKNKFGVSVTDDSLIPDTDIDAYFEEIKNQIPFQYESIFGNWNYNFRLGNQPIDITTIIPGKVNGNKITNIGKATMGSDCDDTTSCSSLYPDYTNYYYNLIISEGIEEIGTSYFNNKQVYSLKLPSTIKSIGASSFMKNHIRNLVLPNGLTNIGNAAFNTNEITGKLVIPDSVTSLGISAFRTNKITEVVISKGLTIIPSQAFAVNQISGKLVIPNNIITINGGAFNNNQITEVVIPESVTTIGNGAFSNNPIKKVTIEGDKTRFNDTWTSIGFPAELMPS